MRADKQRVEADKRVAVGVIRLFVAAALWEAGGWDHSSRIARWEDLHAEFKEWSV
jgi:hypothetical protein